MTFVASDWFGALAAETRYDLIVANPPYLSAEETAAARPEVRGHEPAAALTSGDGGLADLRKIVTAAPRYLTTAGTLALETGIGHHAELARIAEAAGFKRTESLTDLTGRDRFFLAWAEPLAPTEAANPPAEVAVPETT